MYSLCEVCTAAPRHGDRLVLRSLWPGALQLTCSEIKSLCYACRPESTAQVCACMHMQVAFALCQSWTSQPPT